MASEKHQIIPSVSRSSRILSQLGHTILEHPAEADTLAGKFVIEEAASLGSFLETFYTEIVDITQIHSDPQMTADL